MKRKVASKKVAVKSAKERPVALLVGTRKGAFILRANAKRKTWKTTGPHFFGHIVYHMVLDPRDGKTIMVGCRAGHLGPTVFRSTNFGKSWHEAKRPPAFQKQADGSGRVVDHVFWLTPGHASEKGTWYAGTSPHGLFRTRDGGDTWEPLSGFNDHPDRVKWTGGEQDQTPDGPKLHSIIVDPRDAKHLYLGMSSGGCIESCDAGATWSPLNDGCERVFPVEDPDVGHDPHCIQMAPSNPDRLYMQNHCGIYRVDRPSATWQRIGKAMPKKIGDVGFPIAVHPRDHDVAWVFPMDGTSVWPRTSIGGKPCTYRTENGGKSWTRQDKGLPKEQAWFTVKRQALAVDDAEDVGVYFGTTSGEVWASRNGGAAWTCIASHLPHIYAVEAARI